MFKKTVLASLFLFSFLQTAIALPIGNPADPALYQNSHICCPWNDYFSVRFGYYGDFVFNRHLKRASGPDKDGVIDRARIITNSGFLALNFCERADLFGTLGASSIRILTPSASNAFIDHEYNSVFSWSVGARAIAWQCGCAILGVEGQYSEFKPETTRLTIGMSSDYPDAKATVREWQFGVGLAYRISFFVPYVGAKWSRIRIDNRDALAFETLTIPDFKNSNHFGYAFGVTLVDCKLATVAAEARFGDEKALAINGQIRF